MAKQIICSKCVYDTSIPGIRFDEKGVCQYCHIHGEMERKYPADRRSRSKLLKQLVEKIKKDGRGKRYDCVIGVSGGTDSMYTIYQAVKHGLRPLAVHFDNGWNGAIAVRNIAYGLKKYGLDLETLVADWEEFKDLQLSFLKASVSDAEIPTDVVIHATLHKIAAKEGIKHILIGHSFRTEGIVPRTWTYMDGKYINSVHKIFGTKKITSFPNVTLWNYFYWSFIKHIKVYPFLNYFDYSKEEARKTLERYMDWKYYGGHHHESTYTKFFQTYYLPKKFGIDKRKLALSASIRSGKITRQRALKILNQKTYLNEDNEEIRYIRQKLHLSPEEFAKIMHARRKSFLDYPTYYPLLRLAKPLLWLGVELNIFPEIIYFKYLI